MISDPICPSGDRSVATPAAQGSGALQPPGPGLESAAPAPTASPTAAPAAGSLSAPPSEGDQRCGVPGLSRAARAARFTEAQHTEALRRQNILEAFAALIAQDIAPADAAKAVSASLPTLWRWRKAFERDGFKGLLGKRHLAGRESELDKLRKAHGPAAEEFIARAHGKAADTESVTTAIRHTAQVDFAGTAVGPELKQLVNYTREGHRRRRKQALPPSIRDAVKIDKNQRRAHRGPRFLMVKGLAIPRVVDIDPGDVITGDDTTPIWAYWVPTPWTKGHAHFPRASCEYQYGETLLQGQFLPIMDVASQCIISWSLIARATAGYRACDIWALLGHTFDQVGLPRLGVQFERGSWEAILLRGKNVVFADGEVSLERRVGGLRQLPTNVTAWHRQRHGPEWADMFPKTLQTWTSYSPNSKSIEGLFNRSQMLEGMLWGCAGRDQMRKPNEKVKAMLEKGQRGALQPSLNFLSGAEIHRRLGELVQYINHEPVEGEVFRGVPQELFDQARRERPLYFLPEEQRFLYRRCWAAGVIRRGLLAVPNVTLPNGDRRTVYYTNPRLFGQNGFEERRVLCYYDANCVEQAAQIVDPRTGEYLGDAQHFERVGMFCDSTRRGHDLKKAFRETVMTHYGTAVEPYAPSRQEPAEVTARRATARAEAAASAPVRETSPTSVQRAPVLPAPARPALPVVTERQRNKFAQQAAQAARLSGLKQTA